MKVYERRLLWYQNFCYMVGSPPHVLGNYWSKPLLFPVPQIATHKINLKYTGDLVILDI